MLPYNFLCPDYTSLADSSAITSLNYPPSIKTMCTIFPYSFLRPDYTNLADPSIITKRNYPPSIKTEWNAPNNNVAAIPTK